MRTDFPGGDFHTKSIKSFDQNLWQFYFLSLFVFNFYDKEKKMGQPILFWSALDFSDQHLKGTYPVPDTRDLEFC